MSQSLGSAPKSKKFPVLSLFIRDLDLEKGSLNTAPSAIQSDVFPYILENWNQQEALQLYREERLMVRWRRGRKRALGTRAPMTQPRFTRSGPLFGREPWKKRLRGQSCREESRLPCHRNAVNSRGPTLH